MGNPVSQGGIACLLVLGGGADPALGAEPPTQGEVQLPATVLDVPFNLHGGYALPSMQQSLDAAWAVDRLAILGIQEGYRALLPEREGLRTGLGIATSSIASLGFSYVGGWMHEEWHRAVMTSHGISSRNGIYHAEAWSNGFIAVDHVDDEDLARLKEDHPAQMVRLAAAGMEAEDALVDRAGEELFFHGGEGRTWGALYMADSWMAPPLLVTELGTLAYYALCTDSSLDVTIDEENARLEDVEDRDFTGPDCTAWVYDLHRPDEAYADRGVHPSGTGIDRYVKWSDLTAEEQAHLQRELRLHLLNFVNPHLLGINGVVLGDGDSGDRWIAWFDHLMIPWGSTVDFTFALRLGGFAGEVVLHNGLAEAGWFPGIDLAVWDRPLPGTGLTLDGGLGFWLQPRDLRYDATERMPTGRLHGRLSWRALGRMDAWIATELHTTGWSQGRVSLEPGWRGALGLTGHLR